MRNRTAGITLYEVIGTLAIMAVIIPLVSNVFVDSLRLSSYTGRAFDRVDGLVEVQRLFGDTVRESTGIAARAGDYETGATYCVLRLPADGDSPRYAILGPTRAPDRLSVMRVRKSGDDWEPEAWTTLPVPLQPIRFTYGQDGEPAVTLTAAIRRDQGEPGGEPPRWTWAASPRASAKGIRHAAK